MIQSFLKIVAAFQQVSVDETQVRGHEYWEKNDWASYGQLLNTQRTGLRVTEQVQNR